MGSLRCSSPRYSRLNSTTLVATRSGNEIMMVCSARRGARCNQMRLRLERTGSIPSVERASEQASKRAHVYAYPDSFLFRCERDAWWHGCDCLLSVCETLQQSSVVTHVENHQREQAQVNVFRVQLCKHEARIRLPKNARRSHHSLRISSHECF